jgi:putative spermidine/putrescine transport system permease protein
MQAAQTSSIGQRISNFLYLRPRVLLGLMLVPPVLWLGVVYLGSLLTLLLQSFFYLDDFTGQVVRRISLVSYSQLFSSANQDIILRTVGMAAAVTLASIVLAFPLAYYMAMYARPRTKALLYLAVMLPLWSSYLVRVYAWKLILAKEGIISWFASQIRMDWALEGLLSLPGIGGPSLSISPIGLFLVFTYVWLPFMILPIQTALERVPVSLLEASGDMGATPPQTFRHITLPLAVPGVVAGSIFTFSLTLGDFIIPTILGNSSFFIGQAVYSHQGTSGNIPLAAALTTVPIMIMGVYLLLAKRTGAFEAL